MVLDQLRYLGTQQKTTVNHILVTFKMQFCKYILGMLDLIRIRREGYPVHIDFTAFVSLYKCLCKGLRLPKDAKEAVCKILTTLKYPTKDWQVMYCFLLYFSNSFLFHFIIQ